MFGIVIVPQNRQVKVSTDATTERERKINLLSN